MITIEEARDIIGATAYGSDGEKIGKVGQVYLDDTTGQPAWATVNTGLFGMSESFVPLANARAEGDRIEVGYPKDKVKDAPRIEADQHLSEDEEETLYDHYGMGHARTAEVGHEAGMAGHEAGRREPAGYAEPTGRAAPPARETDDAMTRSEEHLKVGKASREAGRARLRKYVVTEHEQVSVPVTHEEVRVEREPITEANREAATSGPEISEDEHEVVLHEERPVVETEVTPVERVRLSTEEVTEQETVSGEVRKERVETDIPDTYER